MHKDHKCGCSKTAWVIVVIGALVWGLIGLGYFFGSNWNLVNLVFGNMMWLEAIIYLVFGIAGIVMIVGCRCKNCKEGCDKCKVGGTPASKPNTPPVNPSTGAPMQGM